MKVNNAIEVNNITKKFKVYMDKGRTLKEIALFSKRRKYEERKVLNGISFQVKKGEAVGLIGHNGCGKSTTLKLLTKIMYPNSGEIEMCGRVSSLIELGAGFHPDMSGRQNIYTNASIFGLTRREIDARLDDIIAFSELEEFIDNPVRTYSSGMYMRLAFSVAINVNAEILLIDEILAVGDVNFQAKCFNKLKEIKAAGTTIIIVSHSLGQIEQFCDRSIWIHNGKIAADGSPREIHPQYMDYMGEKRQDALMKSAGENAEVEKQKEDQKSKRWGTGEARIRMVSFLGEDKKQKNIFKTGQKASLMIEYVVKTPVFNGIFGVGFFRTDGIQCYGTNTRIEKIDDICIKKDGVLEVVFNTLDLLPGKYTLDVAIQKEQGESVDYYKEACCIEVYSDIEDVGVIRMNHKWNLEGVK